MSVNSAYCCVNTCHRKFKVLTNSLKFSGQTKADFFQLNLPGILEKER